MPFACLYRPVEWVGHTGLYCSLLNIFVMATNEQPATQTVWQQMTGLNGPMIKVQQANHTLLLLAWALDNDAPLSLGQVSDVIRGVKALLDPVWEEAEGILDKD